ncbi:MAG: Hpt domain-containing protein [Fibrobacterota bacterium]|nr:Hpt domain-containing protein [Fibrobacterota bacterium]QQS07291.1 MAG: Hpt domain-containing protein [Fibrobacterota bacterium]
MDGKVIDKEEALGRLEGDLELWNEIREIWLEDVDALHQAVLTTFEGKAPDGLRRAAHAIKGASANVGAVRLASVARDLELQSPAADWTSLAQHVDQLGREVENAKKALKEG